MINIDVINNIIQNTMFNILTYFVFIRLINYQENNKRKNIVIFLISISEGIIGRILYENLTTILAVLLTYSLHSVVIAKVTNRKVQYSIVITFISLTIAYLIYIVSTILSCLVLKLIIPNINKNNVLILIMTASIETLIIYSFFKIKRFKNGIVFLRNEEKINNIGIIGGIFVGITIIIYSTIGEYRGYIFNTYLFLGILIEAICMFIWIRRKITKHYKQNLRKNEIKELETQIKNKDEEIAKILKENNAIATINHKYSSRIRALEKISSKIFTKPEIIKAMQEEFGEEFGELQEQINKITEEYTNEMSETVKYKNKLDKTGIFGIDNLLEYLQEEAENKGIKFEVKINGSINYLIEKLIEQNRLETLLGDHIKDAIIAIEHSTNTYKQILLTIGIIENCYEIRIYDTGIEFEIETLLNLGTKPITTHKETGGSGIGFITTFETLDKTKASLIIEEKHPINSVDYTKVVSIRFDGKKEYKIKSYRKEEIKKQRKDNRIIVK